jgi:hypothetical protein
MTISKKDQLAYWSSEAFLNEYFSQLEFNEKYAKATGSIAGQWVRNPWTIKIRGIVFKFVKSYVKKYHCLPEGEHIFKVNWRAPNAKWLKNILLKEQVVTFPKLKE